MRPVSAPCVRDATRINVKGRRGDGFACTQHPETSTGSELQHAFDRSTDPGCLLMEGRVQQWVVEFILKVLNLDGADILKEVGERSEGVALLQEAKHSL